MILTGLLLNLLIGAATLVAFWLVYLWKKNPSVVDVGWASGLTLMGLAHSLRSSGPSSAAVITGALVLLWGLRLGGYLFWTRVRKGKRDPRYETLHDGAEGTAPIRVLMHYMLQACFQAVVGLTLIFTPRSPVDGSVWMIAGMTIWFAGYAGSIVADAQLHRFKTNPDNRGRVCEQGLWNYSRHPNYFFEILLWTGFALIGVPAKSGWVGMISPLALLLTMAFITGPISEQQSLKSKPEAYGRYRRTTSMIVPWFKRRHPEPARTGS